MPHADPSKARPEPCSPHAAAPEAPAPGLPTRRAFTLSCLGVLLAGCASTPRRDAGLPGPAWEARPVPPGQPAPNTGYQPPVVTSAPTPAPAPVVHSTPAPAAAPGIIARAHWASGGPVTWQMNPMRPVRYITVHHSGMDPYFGTDQRAVAARIDLIRRSHRGRGWADIGYHYVVDRTGRVWQGRPVGYQGAHVKNYNEGNIGVVALGNFDQQDPTPAQLTALNQQVANLMRDYRVPLRQVRTHQEWAATACPGARLQRHMSTMRGRGMLV